MKQEPKNTERSSKLTYEQVKNEMKELTDNGWLFSFVKLNKATTVLDGKKFVESSLSFLEHQLQRKKKREKLRGCYIMPAVERLHIYYLVCKEKVKNN